MPVGSHKDAFKAHQKVKRLMRDHEKPVLARMASEILLDFIRNLRQVVEQNIHENLPTDTSKYNSRLLDDALQTVCGLCGKCQEAHHDSCYVNQARRVLIAAKTGVDLGPKLTGSGELDDLLKKAYARQITKSEAEKSGSYLSTYTLPETYDELKTAYEEMIEKDIYRSSLIDEIVNTIGSVAAGNLAIEMPVHDDPQLGKMATAFNIMLSVLNASMQSLETAFESMVRTLSTAIEARHPITAGHSHRVTEYSVLLGKKMGLSEEDLQIIKYAGLLHDIGKMAIPDAVLTKKGRFDPDERKIMENHALWTMRILEPIELPKGLKSVPIIAGSHHEKVDGTGYPYGLSKSEIPFFACILAVGDVFDALTSIREYPKYDGTKTLGLDPMPKDRVFDILEKDQNSHFHPDVVKIALDARGDLEALWHDLHTFKIDN
ncbi:MAG: Metal-dependent phosphohydrolase [Candidatus Magnetoglobus multicellularis str. Araruama]|uniref:Metal-dependent phosphohydrolase n=1 Tax=Candidatus Magnetoglobus multicellularis str. Araruama TaxID=890399 RepID=A0A1V1PBN9_9BACT|nr:MAG: Metal-dependent phosphohydrolase [Candidatus Magnetoglobus multicellularis str. Araruama]